MELDSYPFFTPIFDNEDLSPGRADPGFKIWSLKGLAKVSHLYRGHQMTSFQDLATNFDIPQNHFFKYLQIRNLIKSKQNESLAPPTPSILEDIVLKHMTGRGQISTLYNALVSRSKESSMNILKALNSDMDNSVSEKEWKEACS